MKADSSVTRAEEAEALARDLLAYARALKNSEPNAKQVSRFWPRRQKATIDAIDSIIQARRQRLHHLDPALFGEPAWDMLLLLYKASLWGTDMPVSGLCALNGLTQATGRRWVSVLIKTGLAEMAPSDADDADPNICLTETGAMQMAKTMIDLQATLLPVTNCEHITE